MSSPEEMLRNAVAAYQAGRLSEAEFAYRQVLRRRQGRLPEAAQTVAAWLVREPTNPIALHMAAAFSGEDSPSRAPDEYVRTYFDAFADDFDSTLKTLDYRGPELVTAELAAFMRSRPQTFDAIVCTDQ
jgi:predicted TPR repeat methyltransferase